MAQNGSAFDAQKASVLDKLAQFIDKSPKGSVDAPIVDFVNDLNGMKDYVTTSSCSGRISLFHGTLGDTKGGKWLLAKHDTVEPNELETLLLANVAKETVKDDLKEGCVLFKHEPFVMHVQCRNADCAQEMLQVAMACGFRESGISIGNKKVMLGIRTAANHIELPVVQNGKLLVPVSYFRYLETYANQKFLENERRTKHLYQQLVERFPPTVAPPGNNKEPNLSSPGQVAVENSKDKQGIPWHLLQMKPPKSKKKTPSLLRWGHTATAVEQGEIGPQILVFGGYGVSSDASHQKLNDLVRIVPETCSKSTETDSKSITEPCNVLFQVEEISCLGEQPLPRLHHSADLIQNRFLVIFGGRQSPQVVLNDVAVFDVLKCKWLLVEYDTNAQPCGRFSHRSVQVNNSVYVYGGRTSEEVLCDMWKLDVEVDNDQCTVSFTRVSTETTCPPGPRFLHSMLAVNDSIIIYGGKTSLLSHPTNNQVDPSDPVALLNASTALEASMCKYNTASETWEVFDTGAGELPRSRFGHAALPIDCDGEHLMLVGGGICGEDFIDNGMVVIDPRSGTVRAKVPSSDRYGASIARYCMMQKTRMVYLDCKGGLYVAIGGGSLCFSFGFHFNPTLVMSAEHVREFVLNGTTRSTQVCSAATLQRVVSGPASLNRATTLSTVQDNTISSSRSVTACLAPAKYVKQLKVALENKDWLDKSSRITRYDGDSSGRMALPITHQCLDTVGWQEALNLSSQLSKELLPLEIVRLDAPVAKHILAAGGRGKKQVATNANRVRKKAKLQQAPKTNNILGNNIACVVVSKGNVKALKVALEKIDCLHKGYRIKPHETDRSKMCLPVTSEGATRIESCISANNYSYLFGDETFPEQISLERSHGFQPAKHLLANGGTGVLRGNETKANVIVQRIADIAMKLGISISSTLESEIPSKFEILSDVAFVSKHAFKSRDIWQPLLEDKNGDVWKVIAQHTQCARVLLSSEVDQGPKRESLSKIVYPKGETTCWVEVKQNGLWYCLDLTKCMFSSGNITEKQRVAKLGVEGETIVDLYAGIGYFTLPYLVHGKAAVVHACEWNPNSIQALEYNLKRNNVSERCVVHPGDNQVSAKSIGSIADRVNLGLLPTSELSWPLAVQVLKPTGGWLHVHDNVKQSEQEVWRNRLVAAIKTLLNVHKPIDSSTQLEWSVTCQHVEKVKSYAPRVLHLVADVECRLVTPQATAVPFTATRPSLGVVRKVNKPSSLEEVHELIAQRTPFVISNAAASVSATDLLKLCETESVVGEHQVSAHVAPVGESGRLSFVNKNFQFTNMKLVEMMRLVLSSDDTSPSCYLRAVGPNPRKDRADIWRDFPKVAEFLGLESFPSSYVSEDRYFSSVLRIASKNLQLWTHYDVMDNFLFQTSGRKRVTLFRPQDADCLYMSGSSSPVVDMNPDSHHNKVNFPKFGRAIANSFQVVLEPGDVLFIPALWPHNAHALDPSLAVNIFFRHLSDEGMYASKDLYGNRDPIPIEKAMELVQQACDQMIDAELPQEYRVFYGKLAIQSMKQNLLL